MKSGDTSLIKFCTSCTAIIHLQKQLPWKKGWNKKHCEGINIHQRGGGLQDRGAPNVFRSLIRSELPGGRRRTSACTAWTACTLHHTILCILNYAALNCFVPCALHFAICTLHCTCKVWAACWEHLFALLCTACTALCTAFCTVMYKEWAGQAEKNVVQLAALESNTGQCITTHCACTQLRCIVMINAIQSDTVHHICRTEGSQPLTLRLQSLTQTMNELG